MTEFLEQHPEIHLIGKEVHFFGSDLEFRRVRPNATEYLRRCAAAAQVKRLGDASVYYLYSQRAAQEIRAFCGLVRIIVMLRNPVEVMHALHTENVSNLDEDITDFEEAIAAEPDRIAGRRIPKSTDPVHALRYRRIVAFAEQVERYFDVFGRENVKVIIHDDLKADVRAVYRETLSFLGVDEAFSPTFRQVNEPRAIRSKLLVQIDKSIPRRFRNVVGKGFPEPVRHWLFWRLRYQMLWRKAARPPMRPELRARLAAELAPEVARLGALLGRDLTHWSKPNP